MYRKNIRYGGLGNPTLLQALWGNIITSGTYAFYKSLGYKPYDKLPDDIHTRKIPTSDDEDEDPDIKPDVFEDNVPIINIDQKVAERSAGSRTITVTEEEKKKKRKANNNMGGQYTGPFPWPSKKPRVGKDIFALKGSKGCSEITGSVSTPQVAYIGFQSMIRTMGNTLTVANNAAGKDNVNTGNYAGSATYHVAAALLRHILARENLQIEHWSQTINNLYGYDNIIIGGGNVPTVNKIDFLYLDTPVASTNTAVTTGIVAGKPEVGIGYTLVFDATNNMARFAQLIAQNVICGANFGARGNDYGSLYSNRQLYGYITYITDATSSTTAAVAAKSIVRLDTTKVNVETKSNIYIQNVTPNNSSATAVDGGAIDTNPLKGRLYYFAHPNPVIRTANQITTDGNAYELMYDVNEDAVIYPKDRIDVAQTTAALNTWSQLPQPEMFVNLKAYENIRLDPGEIKKLRLTFKFDGMITDYIRGLKLHYPVVSTQEQAAVNYDITKDSKALGTSVLFAFDKRIAAGGNNVIINFQREMWTRAVITKKGKNVALPQITGEVTAVQDTVNYVQAQQQPFT